MQYNVGAVDAELVDVAHRARGFPNMENVTSYAPTGHVMTRSVFDV